ncbi:MAG TPA: hypothetical protein VGL42_13430 [Opitutaceae bacterium]|jgi:predicted GIY-YIG superfamily endonuclease
MTEFSPLAYVFVVRCSARQVLIGVTSNARQQLKSDNGGLPFYFGEVRQVVTLIYLEGPYTQRMAARREAEIRGWPPEKLTAHIGFTDRRRRRMRAEINAIGADAVGGPPDPHVFHTAQELSGMLSFIRSELEDEMVDRERRPVEQRSGRN